MNKILKKDIIIPAGSVFVRIVPGDITQYGSGNYVNTVGLTKDSCGDFVYCVDENDDELDEWFEDI